MLRKDAALAQDHVRDAGRARGGGRGRRRGARRLGCAGGGQHAGKLSPLSHLHYYACMAQPCSELSHLHCNAWLAGPLSEPLPWAHGR